MRFDGEHFEFVGAEQGLDLNSCFAIYEDRDGHVWFGGGNGLFRYDGQGFEKMDTTASFGEVGVSAIAEDQAGQLLFGKWENGTIKKERRAFCQSTADRLPTGMGSAILFLKRREKIGAITLVP